MKVLFNNVLEGATYASVNQKANYPADNVADPFLRLRYEVGATSDSLLITLAESVSINCFFLGYIGNLAELEVQFLTGGEVQNVIIGATHEVETGGAIRVFETDGAVKAFANGAVDFFDTYDGEESAVRFFETVSNIDQIRILTTGTNPFYIGGIGAGFYTELPPALIDWTEGIEDNTVTTRSPHGQTMQQYIEPLDVFSFTFQDVSYEEYLELRQLFKSVSSKPIWVSFFDDVDPGYYSTTLKSARRSMYTYTITIDFKEAR